MGCAGPCAPRAPAAFDSEVVTRVASRNSRTGEAMAAEKQRDAQRRVLVVEDNVDSAETMQMLLEMSGFEVRTAYDAASGIAAAREFSPHVVCCDIGLPGKNGYEVARELRGMPETRSAYLVALTGYGHEDDRRRAADAGFDAFQVKPVEPDALEKLLTEYFAGREA